MNGPYISFFCVSPNLEVVAALRAATTFLGLH
jgi:hypothetical protein